MAIDASIYAQFAPRQRSALEAMQDAAGVDAARGSIALQKLALARGQDELDASQQARERASALDRFRASLGGKSDSDVIKAYRDKGYFSEAGAIEKGVLDREEARAKIGRQYAEAGKASIEADAASFKARAEKADKALRDIAALANADDARSSIERHFAAGDIDETQYRATLATLPTDPASFGAWQLRMLKNIMSAKDRLAAEHQQKTADETARHNRATEGLTARGQNMADTRARELHDTTKQTAADAKKEAATEQAITKFSAALQKDGIPEIEAALQGAEGVFSRYRDPKTGKVGDMPGVGAVKNALPDWAVSSEGKDVRESMTAVANIVLAARSGAAVTDQELRRLARELSNSVGSSAQDMERAYAKFRKRFELVKANAAAGVSDDVLRSYQDRGGVSIQRGGRAEQGGASTPRVVDFRSLPGG